MEKQQRLAKPKIKYSYGSYNKFDDVEQWIRITEGCPHNCPWCYEPSEIKIFGIPEIVRNEVKIIDMNLLAKPEAIGIIKELGLKKVNNKVVYYSLIAGIDYRFLTKEIAFALKKNRFKDCRLAWDWGINQQYKLKDAVDNLLKAGYKPNNITIYMVCNYKICSYEEQCQKLDLCKVWGVKVVDCWYDNQISPNIIPLHWQDKQIKDFRKKCRKHNQLVNFKIDPEVKSPHKAKVYAYESTQNIKKLS